MSTWTPKKGEKVKLSVRKTWGANQGEINIRLDTVTQVTAAGFVKTTRSREVKFHRANERMFREWHPRSWGFSDYITYLEPASAEDINTLPSTDAEGRAFAKAQREKEVA